MQQLSYIEYSFDLIRENFAVDAAPAAVTIDGVLLTRRRTEC